MTDEHPIDPPPDPLDFGKLAAALESTQVAFVANQEAFEARLVASHRKWRWVRRGTVVAAIVGCIGTWAGLGARHAIDEMKAQRRESRVTACRSYNDDLAANVNKLNDRTQNLLRSATASNPNRTPEQQATVDQFLQNELDEYEQIKVPLRDCSPAGIDAYYSGSTTTTR